MHVLGRPVGRRGGVVKIRCWPLMALGLLTGRVAQAAPPLYFGSVAMDIPVVMAERLGPLTHYLSQTLHRPVVLRLSASLPEAADDLAHGRTDIAYLTPVAYLRARALGARPIVRFMSGGRPDFRLDIVVRCGGPITRISEISGHRFAFGDPAAVLQQAVVAAAGIPLAGIRKRFLGHYDNIGYGIKSGDFDVGIMPDVLARAWRAQGLCVLHQSAWLPPYNLSARPGLPQPVFRAVRQALLALNGSGQARGAPLAALDPRYDGVASASPRDYRIVRRMIAPWGAPAPWHGISRTIGHKKTP